MMLADVNVLLAAYRPDAAAHAVCSNWLSGVIRADRPFGISTQVLNSVVRIATTRKAFDPPSQTKDALEFCRELLAQPHAVRIEPGERHWDIFEGLCAKGGIRSARVTDAWFAAISIEAGTEWITMDRDFARFPGLKWRLLEAD